MTNISLRQYKTILNNKKNYCMILLWIVCDCNGSTFWKILYAFIVSVISSAILNNHYNKIFHNIIQYLFAILCICIVQYCLTLYGIVDYRSWYNNFLYNIVCCIVKYCGVNIVWFFLKYQAILYSYTLRFCLNIVFYCEQYCSAWVSLQAGGLLPKKEGMTNHWQFMLRRCTHT